MNGQDRPNSDPDSLRMRKMEPADAANGLRLSRLAGWNQTVRDWDLLLTEGTGFGFQTGDGLLVASMIALPLGPRHGWISMVLTDPDWRRRGLAKRLMAEGIDILEKRGLIPTLDATPAGETVYRAIGFSGDTGLARWKVSPDPSASVSNNQHGLKIRPIVESDLERLADWDCRHSGCNREAILIFLRKHRPDLAYMAEDVEGNLQGYIMGRSGDRLPQLGPLVATGSLVAGSLLQAAATGAADSLYVDAFDQTRSTLEASFKGSWSRERGFKRLLKGASASPEDPETVFLAAGPELS
jgi:GNAT superfamily N-acetyltransferase